MLRAARLLWRGVEQPAAGSRSETGNKRRFRAASPRPVTGDAGWSSPVARQAHNLKVAGSNPAPATKKAPAARRGPSWFPAGRGGRDDAAADRAMLPSPAAASPGRPQGAAPPIPAPADSIATAALIQALNPADPRPHGASPMIPNGIQSPIGSGRGHGPGSPRMTDTRHRAAPRLPRPHPPPGATGSPGRGAQRKRPRLAAGPFVVPSFCGQA